MNDCPTDSEIEKLLDSMTKSGAQELNPNQMKLLKNYCRKSDDNIDRVFRSLFHELNKSHSQIRVTTLLIIADLFQRSHRFRQLMVENLYELFELCLELNPKRKLPKPKSFATKLKQMTIDLIQKWSKEFGEGYEELRSALKYLKDNRLVDFTDRTVQNQIQQKHEEEDRKRRQNVLKLKIERCVQQLSEIEAEVKSLLTQINSCFELLLPQMTDNSDDNTDLQRSAERVRHLNDFSIEIFLKPYIEIVDNEDTNPIIINLRELHSELTKILDSKLKHLIQIMSKGSDLCEKELKQGIHLKCQIENISQKFFDLKIIKAIHRNEEPNGDNCDDSSDEDFEEVEDKPEDLELLVPDFLRQEYGLEPLQPKPSTSKVQTESDSSSDTVIKCETELKSRLECRARLPSGRLCPRKDQIKCPFHGRIVARDNDGLPIHEEDRKREEAIKAKGPPDWQNPQLLKELKASIGIDLTVKKGKRKKKYPELQDIKQTENNSRKRLERRVFKKSVRERVERDLDAIQHKNQTHFEDQWNYSLQS